MRALRAAIIGLGVGERHIAGYNSHPQCQVVSLCDSNPEKLREVGSRHPHCSLFSDASHILKDESIDIVSIASFDNYHKEQVIQAIDNGKHVFVEKPLCLTEEELKDIVYALERNPNQHLSSNFILRRVPRFIELKSNIDSGKMGRLYYLDGDYDYGRLHKILYGWRSEISNYSVFLGGGIHLVDLVCWLSKKKVLEVFAYGNKISTENSKFSNLDLVVALLKFSDGVVAKISANFGSVTPHHHKISVYGTKGTFTQDHMNAAYIFSRDPSLSFERVDGIYPGAAKGDMIPSFIRQILGEGLADIEKQDVIDSMSVGLAIEKSLKSGDPQAVNYYNERTKSWSIL